MAWSSDDLTKLEQAIARGAKKVKFKDNEIEFHSVNEMFRLRRAMRKELGLGRRARRVSPSLDKGL